MSGLAAEGKERYTEYNKDKADGKVDWAKEAKDASKDWRGQVELTDDDWNPLRPLGVRACYCRLSPALASCLHCGLVLAWFPQTSRSSYLC